MILVLNAALLVSICHTNQKTNRPLSRVRKPTIMLSLVTLIELVSLVPVVYMIMIHHTDPRNSWLFQNIEWFRIFAVYMISLNVCVDPLIYLATNRSFRNFLRGVVACKRGVEVGSIVSEFGSKGPTTQHRVKLVQNNGKSAAVTAS